MNIGTKLLEVMALLYEREMNCEISTFFDGGLSARLGDVANGFTWDSGVGWYDGDELADALSAAAVQAVLDA